MFNFWLHSHIHIYCTFDQYHEWYWIDIWYSWIWNQHFRLSIRCISQHDLFYRLFRSDHICVFKLYGLCIRGNVKMLVLNTRCMIHRSQNTCIGSHLKIGLVKDKHRCYFPISESQENMNTDLVQYCRNNLS